MSSAGAESLFGVGLAHGYRPLAGVNDEMVDANGALRPHWRRLLDLLGELGAENSTRASNNWTAVCAAPALRFAFTMRLVRASVVGLLAACRS
mgnify:CR=1 FL=1